MIIRPFLALLLLLGAPVAHAQTLSGDAEVRWVPFTLTAANHLRFAMTVDGVPAQALLDTGLNHSAVSRDFARRAKLTIDPKGAASGVALGGAIRVDWAATKSIAFGALSRSGGRVAVIDLPQLLASASGDAEVLVGTDLIAPNALDIDFANRRFRLLPSGRMPFAGTKVPMTFQAANGLYLTEAMVGKRRIRPLMVDTGDGGSLSIARSQWRPAEIGGRASPRPSRSVRAASSMPG
ncbi:aspartyl protease family protein [Sphingomonas hankookensis]|uniref:aspartyl protease family protein n=1 Tax=Sphingomonas hankookensis TaxID=563996 RepID=UPI003F79D31D